MEEQEPPNLRQLFSVHLSKVCFGVIEHANSRDPLRSKESDCLRPAQESVF